MERAQANGNTTLVAQFQKILEDWRIKISEKKGELERLRRPAELVIQPTEGACHAQCKTSP
jgi:hypothetical protein